MKHVRIIAVVLTLALAIAWSGCVDSDSGKEAESRGDGAPPGTAQYLDLIDVTSMHYKATVSADDGDTAVFEEWRKKSGEVWFFKLVLTSNQGADSVTILQNADGMYMVDEAEGTAIKTGECSRITSDLETRPGRRMVAIATIPHGMIPGSQTATQHIWVAKPSNWTTARCGNLPEHLAAKILTWKELI